MGLQKGDFIEIDFTGRVKDGEVFDSTVSTELEKLQDKHDHPIEAKPFIFCLGHGMFLETLDEFLVGKEIGKTYEVELPPEKAFGNRNSKLIQMIPLSVFKKQNLDPAPGFSFNFDGHIGKILTVSSGRVVVDFNHFLAGKTVQYKISILRLVTDINEKIKALNNFFFRRDFPFKISENKIIIEADKQFVSIIPLFSDKFKEMLGLEILVEEIAEKK